MDAMHDPLHEQAGCSTAWTRVNIGEAIAGVPTPLGWTWWGPSLEMTLLRSYAAIGVLARSEIRYAASVDDRLVAIFHGRAAGNVDRMRAMAERIPGTSADALELHFLGSVRPGVSSHPTRRRYPFVAAKLPVAALSLPRRLRRLRVEIDDWWRRAVATAPADLPEARRSFDQALAWFARALALQNLAGMVCQPQYEQLGRVAARAGFAGLETRLATSTHHVEEAAELMLLWDVSKGRAPVEEFVRAYGYHGPAEGELSSRSWREDPAALGGLVERLGEMDDIDHPLEVLRRRAEDSAEAETMLLDSLARRERPPVRVLLRAVRHYVPQREVGKACFLRAIDAGRAAARSIGTQLCASGVLADADDVFYLTVPEVLGDVPAGVREVVEFRRARRDGHRQVALPEAWTGVPPIEPIRTEADGLEIRGIGVSAGLVEGRVRVVHEPDDAALLPGEILVCETTDPSWAALFFIASGLVIDIGGPLSHGAIVARELGVPCVIGAGRASRLLRTGDHVRIDGQHGTVDVLSRVGE